jgi:GT2 family glycosyltransferase
MAVRREVFAENGGFDAENFPDALFDADFCLRLRERNRRIVFTPYAELTETVKAGSSPILSREEKETFRAKWRSALERDPFYNPNLSLRGETFTIEI